MGSGLKFPVSLMLLRKTHFLEALAVSHVGGNLLKASAEAKVCGTQLSRTDDIGGEGVCEKLLFL